MGSSPLTRGKPRAELASGRAQGLIPAHAGKTADSHAGVHGYQAHPRSRGENSHLTRHPMKTRGSSPLTRGKLSVGAGADAVPGLIPAHAGKTGSGARQPWDRGAHPRSRGENEALAASDATDKGSSPLTRGKPHCPIGQIARCAAHPRSRGENVQAERRRSSSRGSSPLTRGKQCGTRERHD